MDSWTSMKEKKQIRIRAAILEDADFLASICKKCFPESIKWNAPLYFRKKRWETLIADDAVEVYVIEVNSKVVGFYVIVTDIESYRSSSKKRFFRLLEFIGSIMLFQNLSVMYVALKKNMDFNRRQNQPEYIKYQKQVEPANIVWGELQGIDPGYRGMGLSKIMQEYVIERAKALGKDIIAGTVERDNKVVINLLESFGYELSSISRGARIYKKRLF